MEVGFDFCLAYTSKEAAASDKSIKLHEDWQGYLLKERYPSVTYGLL